MPGEKITTIFDTDVTNLKASMQEARAAVKQTQAEFRTASAEVELFGQSSEGVQKQIDALKGKLEGQKSVLANLKKQYEEVSKTSGENSASAQKLALQIQNEETAVLKTTKSIQDFESKLEDVQKAEDLAAKNGKSVEDNLKEMSKAASEAGESAKSSANEGFTVLKGALANLAADAAKAVISALKDVAKATIDAAVAGAAYADNINTASVVTGIATDKLQEMAYMADLVDVSTETITGSMTKLTKNMSSAAKGTGEAYAAFETLGVKVTDANGNLKDNEEVFYETIQALSLVENETKRNTLAMTVFGKSAQDLNPLMAAGGDALKAYAEEAHEVGYVLDEETLAALNALQDVLDRLAKVTEAVKNRIGAALAPVLTEFLTPIVDGLAQLPAAIDEEGFGGLVTRLGEMLNQLLGQIISALPSIVTAASQVVGQIAAAILQNLPLLLEATMQIISQLGMGLGEALPTLIPFIVDIVLQIAGTLIDNIDLIVDAGIEILIGLTEGILNALPKLLEKAPEIIQKLVDALQRNAPKLINAAITIIEMLTQFLLRDDVISMLIDAQISITTAIVNALIDNAPMLVDAAIQIMSALAAALILYAVKLVEKAPEIISKFSDALIDTSKKLVKAGEKLIDWLSEGIANTIVSAYNWGKNFVEGLWNGIKDMAGWIKQKIEGFGEDVLGALKDFFGIHSPSTVMRDIIGKNLVAGIADGLDDNEKTVLNSVKTLAGNMKSTLEKDLSTSMQGLDLNGRMALSVEGAKKALGSTVTKAKEAASSSQTINNNYNFTQNNSSPKALSRLQIYRQTKNQITLAKGALA